QDVAPPLVGGHDAVGEEEGDETAVVGEQAQRDVGPLVLAVADAGVLGGGRQHRPYRVHLEDGGNVLEDGGDPLQAHAGVDVLGGKVAHDVVRLVLDELHEHQVPDLDEP